MKSNAAAFISLLGLASAFVAPRDTAPGLGAECHAKPDLACKTAGANGCEDNGGHSLQCTAQLQWQNQINCPDYDGHCDCATGLCAPNDPNNVKIPTKYLSNSNYITVPNVPDGSQNLPPGAVNQSPIPIQPPGATAGVPGVFASTNGDRIIAAAPGVAAGLNPAPVPPSRR